MDFQKLNEGGNAQAIDRNTGEVIKVGDRDAEADKVDLKDVDRSKFKKDFVELFKELDDSYNEMHGEPLWSLNNRDDMLKSGEAFNGSSSHLFGPYLGDEEFIKHKRMVGDIDVTVPEERLKPLFELLAALEGKQLLPSVKYIGQTLKNLGNKRQISALFQYVHKRGARPLFVQVDFEGVEYKGGRPSEFAKFGHSSPWEDVKVGVKGVFHKYLLRSLASAASTRDDIVILTPASPLSPPEKVKVMATTSPAHLLSFSVDGGLRINAVQQYHPDGSEVMVGEKYAFKNVPPKSSVSKRSRADIYKTIFNIQDDPDESTLVLLDSFVGLLQLMKMNFTGDQVETVFKDFVSEKLFSKQAQRLDANNPEVDRDAKMAAIGRFIVTFPALKKYEQLIDELSGKYYAGYKVRKTKAASNKNEGIIRSFIREILSFDGIQSTHGTRRL